jgi:hypothetical protein
MTVADVDRLLILISALRKGMLLGHSEWKFHLYVISCHISIFDDATMFLRRERRNEFHGDQTLSAQITNSLQVMKLNAYQTIE